MILLLLLSFASVFPKTVQVRGLVLDEATKHPVYPCHVIISNGSFKQLSINDISGAFATSIPENNLRYNFEISCVGYETLNQQFSINGDTMLVFSLKPVSVSISEVSVFSRRIKNDGLNNHYFTPKDAAFNVSMTGEVDVVKALQVLPGVSQGMEGTLGLFVRGGNNGNNRIELDGVPVYGSSHLFGLTSVFQAETVSDIAFKMGGVSAQYGNFLSSLTHVKTKNSLIHSPEYSFSVSPFIVGGHALFPLKKEVAGVLIGGRYSLLGHEYQFVKNSFGGEGHFKPQVLDGVIKLNWQIDSLNALSVMAFGTNDYLSYRNETEISQNWSNNMVSIAWVFRKNPRTSFESKVYYSTFQNKQEQKSYGASNQLSSGLQLSSKVQEMALNAQMVTRYNTIRFTTGLDVQRSLYTPASQKIVVSSGRAENFSQQIESLHGSAYLSANTTLSERLTCDAGIRGTYYQSKDYRSFLTDLRLSVNYVLSSHWGVNLSYDHFTQYYHVLEGLPAGWSMDLIVPAHKQFKPSTVHQYYGGLHRIEGQFHFSIGGYYKSLASLTSYINTQNLFGVSDATWEDELDSGSGLSYGSELMVEKRGERWRANLGYTLSKTSRKFPSINNGLRFPFKFDRQHILNFQTQYVVIDSKARKQTFFSTLAFSSGHHTTLAIAEYPGIAPPFWGQREGGLYVPPEMDHQANHRQLMAAKNAYTLPNYMRVDVGYTFLRTRKRYEREFTLSVFNVTNHRNPYLYFHDDNGWHQLTIFSVMPSFRYIIRF